MPTIENLGRPFPFELPEPSRSGPFNWKPSRELLEYLEAIERYVIRPGDPRLAELPPIGARASQ